MRLSVLALTAASLLLTSVVVAVDRSNFKTCEQSSFCKRQLLDRPVCFHSYLCACLCVRVCVCACVCACVCVCEAAHALNSHWICSALSKTLSPFLLPSLLNLAK